MHEVAIPDTRRSTRPPSRWASCWPWTLFAAALLLLVYFVGVDEGATSVFGNSMSLHEWVHAAVTCSASPATDAAGAPHNADLRPARRFCGGLLATGFAERRGGARRDQAIAYEEAHPSPDATAGAELVSRELQSTSGC